MNKASQGIFEIDGYEFSKDTTVEDVKAMEKFSLVGEEAVTANSRPNKLDFCGRQFVVVITLYRGKIKQLELYPREINKRDFESTEAYDSARMDYCENILDVLFDDTVKKEKQKSGIVYKFIDGFVLIPYPYADGRDYEPGGYIYVSYDR